MIPKPLPFMRIGIANLPLILALDIFPFGPFLVLVSLKVLGQALITGALFSYVFLFSLAGTFASALSMYTLRRLLGVRIGFIGISVTGALLSNAAQLGLARLFIFGDSVRYIAPPFLAVGLVTGIALGVFCEYFSRQSKWYAARRGVAGVYTELLRGPAGREHMGTPQRVPPMCFPPAPLERTTYTPVAPQIKEGKGGERFRMIRQKYYGELFSGGALFVAGLCAMPALLFNPDAGGRIAQFLLFWVFAVLAGKKNNPLMTVLVVLGITAFNLLVPYGEVLVSLGAFDITAGALAAGLRRGATLEGLFMLSRVCVRRDLRLPGSFGALVGESFRILSLITERKRRIRAKHLIADLDGLMLELSADNDAAGKRSASPEGNPVPARVPRRRRALGIIILAAAVMLSWLPLVFLRR
jgi:heptaprenyl diphosphate synthase